MAGTPCGLEHARRGLARDPARRDDLDATAEPFGQRAELDPTRPRRGCAPRREQSPHAEPEQHLHAGCAILKLIEGAMEGHSQVARGFHQPSHPRGVHGALPRQDAKRNAIGTPLARGRHIAQQRREVSVVEDKVAAPWPRQDHHLRPLPRSRGPIAGLKSLRQQPRTGAHAANLKGGTQLDPVGPEVQRHRHGGEIGT